MNKWTSDHRGGGGRRRIWLLCPPSQKSERRRLLWLFRLQWLQRMQKSESVKMTRPLAASFIFYQFWVQPCASSSPST
jgi:hypothetical protein